MTNEIETVAVIATGVVAFLSGLGTGWVLLKRVMRNSADVIIQLVDALEDDTLSNTEIQDLLDVSSTLARSLREIITYIANRLKAVFGR